MTKTGSGIILLSVVPNCGIVRLFWREMLLARYLTIAAAMLACLAFNGTSAFAQSSAQPPSSSGQAQSTADANPNLLDFDFVVEKLRRNYAGWDTKVTDKTRPALDALTARLRVAAREATPQEFTAILREWLTFFDDGHVGITPVSAPASALAGATPPTSAHIPSRAWTEASVRAELDARGAARDPLEGIWQIDDGLYRIGILRTPGRRGAFLAVILTTKAKGWSIGHIKAELTRKADGGVDMLYRAGDHAEHKTRANLLLNGAVLSVTDWGNWVREVPAIADPGLVERALPSDAMFMKPLSASTLWLRIPDFDDSRANPLRDILATNAALIASTPNLVIDLRNNGGGADFVYAPLTPLLYSRPIYSVGVEMRATEDNVTLRKAIADELRTKAPDVAKGLDRQIARMTAALGTFVPGGDQTVYVERLNTVLPFPKRVAVLIDNAASTGEQFLLEARQSRKVTLFGKENSAGTLDFANVVGMQTPSGRFHVFWATSRSMRLPSDPVDPDGIAPDIRIPTDEADPVAFAQRWLERQAD